MKFAFTISVLLIFTAELSFAQKYKPEPQKAFPESNDLKTMSAACQTGSSRTGIKLNNVRTFIYTNGQLWNTNPSQSPIYPRDAPSQYIL